MTDQDRAATRREITDAAVQHNDPTSVTPAAIICRESPRNPLRSPGHSRNTSPTNPTPTPTQPRTGNPSPCGSAISISAAYSGIDATSSAAAQRVFIRVFMGRVYANLP